MTKGEVKDIIREKMKSATKNYIESLEKKEFENCTYYQGVIRGLQDAMEIIGMLDSEHNRM